MANKKNDFSKKLIDKATAHFDDILSQGLKGPIEVPEWDAEIFYKPSTTMFEESKIIELAQNGSSTEALIQSLIMRARDEDGELLFSQADKHKILRGVDPKIILRIVTRFNEDTEEAAEALGN
jgi:hypothetical protein